MVSGGNEADEDESGDEADNEDRWEAGPGVENGTKARFGGGQKAKRESSSEELCRSLEEVVPSGSRRRNGLSWSRVESVSESQSGSGAVVWRRVSR